MLDEILKAFSDSKNLQVEVVLLNLLLAAVLAYTLGVHFIRFGSTFSNRRKFASVLPAIALATVLVITVVKASIALSLGLVGALSIVRFRTPVKEPEELAYLFLAVAIGLGMGADQQLVTIAAIALILGVLTIKAIFGNKKRFPNLYLNIEIPDGASRKGLLDEINELLSERVRENEMRRFDSIDGQLHATFFIECKDRKDLIALHSMLSEKYPKASITFVEQSGIPVP